MKTFQQSFIKAVASACLIIPQVNNSFAQAPAASPAPVTLPIDAAPKGNSKITGSIVDSVGTKGVEFASIALFSVADNKAIDGTTADETGKFTMTKIAAGNYKLLISFIGYKDKAINNIKIEKGKDLELGDTRIYDVCYLKA